MRGELRAHMQVLIEARHDDIRLITEAVAELTVKVDAVSRGGRI